MTTGIILLIMRSGFKTPIEAIPTPLLAVPYAAPKFEKTRADASPIKPKKEAGPLSSVAGEACIIINIIIFKNFKFIEFKSEILERIV
jgi:hypothetical protein